MKKNCILGALSLGLEYSTFILGIRSLFYQALAVLELSLDQANLELKDLTVSASLMLEFKAFATMPSQFLVLFCFFKIFLRLHLA